MGNGQSVSSNINIQNSLLQHIHGRARTLTELYNRRFLDPKFCMTVALIENRGLMNFRKHDLNGVAMTLGLVTDQPRLKQQICNSIIKHYTDRLNLIAAITQSLSYCSDRIAALVTGPRCEGQPELFDAPACGRAGGRWVPTITPPDQSIVENAQWYGYLAAMQDTYIKALSRLLDILRELEDHDEDINNERLRGIGVEVGQLIETMSRTCYELYKLALTTPTFTQADLAMKYEAQRISQQASSANVAALRAVHGLSPTA